MNHVDVALAARAFAAGRAIRRRRFRHRRLLARPIAVVLWQLGAEPFSAAALGWGDRAGDLHTAVAGEARNRDLAFAALIAFARWFNPRFEAAAEDRETVVRGRNSFTVARTAPQVVVANSATIDLLGRLGRRLAYLPTDGSRPADPALVRLGRHLRFLWEHAGMPGQQLVVPLTSLLDSQWATPLSGPERQSLPALAAFIDPPAGTTGFEAAHAAELCPAGPIPDGDDDDRLMPLVEAFNAARRGNTDPAVVGPLVGPIGDHYRPLVRRTWELVWKCLGREGQIPEAPSVGRRWDVDRQAFTRYMDWLARGGLRRTRQTPRQAANTLRDLEEAGRLVAAEEISDDPLCLAAEVLSNRAIRGTVVAVDPSHTEPGRSRRVRRPLVTLRSPDPCLIPVGRELWWTGQPDGTEFLVDSVRPAPGGGSDVVLKLLTGSGATGLPAIGDRASFAAHTTRPRWLGTLPKDDPWTHRPAAAAAKPDSIEDSNPES
jgi:hypothetical protein